MEHRRPDPAFLVPRLPLKLSTSTAVVACLAGCLPAFATVCVDRDELVFSGVHGAVSEALFATVFHAGTPPSLDLEVRIAGEEAAAFAVSGSPRLTLKGLETRAVGIVFAPPAGRIGPLAAVCELVDGRGGVAARIRLRGLAAVGLEGPREPPLAQVFAALGFAVDPGWTTLAGNVEPAPMGEEIAAPRFRRAAPGDVHMLPVARYSPDFPLPFGYHLAGDPVPERVAIGTLARATSGNFEHNRLYPTVATGETRFDPGDAVFGLFTASPTHLAYSDSALNARLEPAHVAHAVRVYPARDHAGRPMPGAFLVCFEEARNGDYQDYVFLLSNVVPLD